MSTDNGFLLKEKVATLKQQILDKHPRMPHLLEEIHTALKMMPENVTLLSDEEINVIVSGLEIQTGFELAVSMTKGSGKSSAVAKIKSLGADAF